MPDFDLDSALERSTNEGHYKVDLKWSVWSCAPSVWESSAPDAWRAIQGLGPGEEVEITAAPNKEIRYARILISRAGSGMWCADGEMTEFWDEADNLCHTLGLPESAFNELTGVLPYAGTEVGISVAVHEAWPTLARLMEEIDEAEHMLIEDSGTGWMAVESWAKIWLEAHRPKRKRRAKQVGAAPAAREAGPVR